VLDERFLSGENTIGWVVDQYMHFGTSNNLTKKAMESLFKLLQLTFPKESKFPSYYQACKLMQSESEVSMRQLPACHNDDWVSNKPYGAMTLDELGKVTDKAKEIMTRMGGSAKLKLAKWTVDEMRSLKCPKCRTPLLDKTNTPKVITHLHTVETVEIVTQ
jgi:hypothetical protein